MYFPKFPQNHKKLLADLKSGTNVFWFYGSTPSEGESGIKLVEPRFAHYEKKAMPSVHLAEQIIGQLLIGQHNGVVSPVKTDSPTLFIDIHCPVDSCGAVSFEYAQVALFLVDCHCEVNYQPLQVNDLIVVADPQNVHLKLSDNSRLVVIGGEPLPEPRFMWWNFVSTNKERIRKAAKDWENQCMWQVPNENDFIPLPKDPLPESLTALLKGAIFLID